MRKVRGDDNPADLFTKHLPARDKVNQLVQLLGCRFSEGRPEASPEMRRERMAQTTLGQAMAEVRPTCKQAFNGEDDEAVSYVMACIGEALAPRPGLLPHMHAEDEITRRFPSMPLLGEEHDLIGKDFILPNHNADVERSGDKIAEEILVRARRERRKRRVSDGPT